MIVMEKGGPKKLALIDVASREGGIAIEFMKELDREDDRSISHSLESEEKK